MIAIKFKYLIGLFSLAILFSCSAPPQETLSISLLETIDSSFSDDDTTVSIIDLFRRFRSHYNTDDLITVLTKGDKIILTNERGEPGNNTLIYTMGNNRIKIHQTLFVTSDNRRHLFFSLDSIHWYSMENNRKKGIFNIDYDFPTETEYISAGGILLINYQWIVNKSEKAIPVRMKNKRVMDLGSDMIFYSKGVKKDTFDLSDYFLRLSRGTELNFNIEFSGNLLKSRNTQSTLVLEILQDFHIYTTNDSNYKLGISLDGKKWNYSILAFKYKIQEYFQTDSSTSLEYSRIMDINYNK